MMTSPHDHDEDYFLPLTDQRVFGAGIKRKRIDFVPATSASSTSTTQDGPSQVSKPTKSAGDMYLSIVMGGRSDTGHNSDENLHRISPPLRPDSDTKPLVTAHGTQSPPNHSPIEPSTLTTTTTTATTEQDPTPATSTATCSVCNQIIPADLANSAHESSIAHQICLQHSHPPSHLDREHVGLKYLSGFGWDPDSRTGLGARAEGIRVPIKAREKRDTAGLGIDSRHGDGDEDDGRLRTLKRKSVVVAKKDEKVVKLNAKETRKVEEAKKRKAEKLRQAFYGEDLSEYLGSGG